MTLRDAGNSLSDLGDVIARDVNIVLTENILDWPIWTFAGLAVLGFGILVLVMVLPFLSEYIFGHFAKAAKMVLDKILTYTSLALIFWALTAATRVLLEKIAVELFTLDGGTVEIVSLLLALICWTIIFVALIYFRNLGREQDT